MPPKAGRRAPARRGGDDMDLDPPREPAPRPPEPVPAPATTNDKSILKAAVLKNLGEDPRHIFSGFHSPVQVAVWGAEIKTAIRQGVMLGSGTASMAVSNLLRYFLSGEALNYAEAARADPAFTSLLEDNPDNYAAVDHLIDVVVRLYSTSAQVQSTQFEDWHEAPTFDSARKSDPTLTVLGYYNMMYKRYAIVNPISMYTDIKWHYNQFHTTVVRLIDGGPNGPLFKYLNSEYREVSWQSLELLKFMPILQAYVRSHSSLFPVSTLQADIKAVLASGAISYVDASTGQVWTPAKLSGPDRGCIVHGPKATHDTANCQALPKIVQLYKDGKWPSPGSTISGVRPASRTPYERPNRERDQSMRGKCFRCASAEHGVQKCPIPREQVRQFFLNKIGQPGRYDNPQFSECPRCGHRHSLSYCPIKPEEVLTLQAAINTAQAFLFPALPTKLPMPAAPVHATNNVSVSGSAPAVAALAASVGTDTVMSTAAIPGPPPPLTFAGLLCNAAASIAARANPTIDELFAHFNLNAD